MCETGPSSPLEPVVALFHISFPLAYNILLSYTLPPFVSGVADNYTFRVGIYSRVILFFSLTFGLYYCECYAVCEFSYEVTLQVQYCTVVPPYLGCPIPRTPGDFFATSGRRRSAQLIESPVSRYVLPRMTPHSLGTSDLSCLAKLFQGNEGRQYCLIVSIFC